MGRRRSTLASAIARGDRQANGCLLWTGSLARDGRYGVISHAGRTVLVHRFVYTETNGTIPDDVHVLHRCDTPLCIEESHLFRGDQAANMADKVAKGRQAVGVACNHPHRVLDDDSVRAIRSLRASGVRIREIAERFECSKSTVMNVILNRSWRHVL